MSYPNDTADSVTQGYDNANNVTLVSSENGGRYDYVPDELNRVVSQTWTYGGQTYITSYHYNPAGCLDTMTYPTGTTLSMTCDTANRVKSVKVGSDVIVKDVIYHPSGQVASMTYGNGKTTLVTYDDRARAVEVTAADVIDLAYGYDGVDNVKSFDNTEVPNSQRTMTYDALDRLETATASSQWGVALYQYDALGNRTYRSVGGGATTFAYDAQNRLASASTDILPNGSMAFTWDDASRMVASSDGATYRYDGHDRRIAKAETTQTTVYHYSPAGQVIAETLPDGTKLREYFYLGNKLIAVDGCVGGTPPNCATERQWYHTDTLGSVLARTDSTGTVWARLDYEPWGEEYSQTGVPGDRRYNGRVYDPGTGFHDYGARLYWPAIGRFVSADTVAGKPESPATLNLYTYVLNNPYKFTDPMGKTLVSVTLNGLGATFLDDAFLPAVQSFISEAQTRGVALSFNSAYRTQQIQQGLQNNPNAITPAQSSLHSCGFAVDVNYSSLQSIPGGMTGNQQRAAIRSAATVAGLSWGGSFATPDPPHFYDDPGFDRPTKIAQAYSEYLVLTGQAPNPSQPSQVSTPPSQSVTQ